MRARIFLPPKSAMQSGLARTHRWVLQYEPEKAKIRDPLMGWTGSDDMRQQIRLTFDSREAAIAYAEAEGIPYDVEIPSARINKTRNPMRIISGPTARKAGLTNTMWRGRSLRLCPIAARCGNEYSLNHLK